MNQRRLILGAAGGSGAALVLVAVVLFAFLGRCDFLLGRTASVHPTPTPLGTASAAPTLPAEPTPTFHVDDSAGGAAGSTAPFTIVPALALRAPCASTCRVEVGCTAACLTAGTQTGGLPPYSYTLAGQLPAGTSFANGLTLAGAV